MKAFKTIILIILAVLLSLLTSYTILDVSRLWSLEFISQFSLLQLYIIIMIIRLLRYKYINQELEEVIDKGYEAVGGSTLYVLIFWGSAYIVHYFN